MTLLEFVKQYQLTSVDDGSRRSSLAKTFLCENVYFPQCTSSVFICICNKIKHITNNNFLRLSKFIFELELRKSIIDDFIVLVMGHTQCRLYT